MNHSDAMQKGQSRGDFEDQSSGVCLGVGAIVTQMVKHFSTADQIQNQIEMRIILVHVSQTRYIGMTSIVVYSKQGLRFALEGR